MSRALQITKTASRLRLCVGMTAALIACVVLLILPWGSLFFTCSLLLWALLVFVYPLASLLLLPVFISSFDLTPWVGWSLLNELDVILPISLSAIFLSSAFKPKAPFQQKPLQKRDVLIIALFCGAWIISLVYGNGLPDKLSLQPSQVFYFSTEYRWSLLKGPLYGLLLLILWRRLRADYGTRAVDALYYGMAAAAFTIFLIAGWERGVWPTLFSSGPYYHRLSALLDFTSTYRITGLLSGMHAGGESIDGLLVLLLAFTMAGWMRFEGWRKSLFFCASAALIYCVIVTFTRTTYAAVGAMFVGALFLAWRFRRAYRPSVPGFTSHEEVGIEQVDKTPSLGTVQILILAGTAVCVLLALVMVYRISGYIGVVAIYAILGVGIAGLFFPRLVSKSAWIAPVLYAGTICLAIYGAITSKWHQAGAGDLATLLVITLSLSGLTQVVSKNVRMSRSSLVQAVMVTLVIGFLAVALLGSYRMEARMENVVSDLQKRVQHWRNVLDSGGPGMGVALLGNGPGAFPMNYALTFPEYVKPVGSFVLKDDGLLLGQGDDLKLVQRLPIVSDTPYNLVIDLTAKGKGNLMVALCERNQLIQVNFYPSCVWQRKPFTKSDRSLSLTINSEHVGRQPWYSRWPTSIHVWNDMYSPPVLLQRISLTQGDTTINLIRNSEFETTADWYFHNDFQHLSWHIKNVPVAIYYELGAIGILMFLVLAGTVVIRRLALNRDDTGLSTPGLLVIVGMMGVGAMGNPLDDVRISMLFFGILFVLLTDKPAQVGQK